jgi:ribosomal protein S18 acetylase RimI-like enzyme
MEKFYYKILPHEGLIFSAVAYVDESPVGFITATHDSTGFMQIALKQYWPQILWLVGTSLLLAPNSIGPVWESWRVMRNRAQVKTGELQGEILSFGVLSAYREPSFIRQSGLRISNDLLEHAVGQIYARGVRKIRAIVCAENNPAKLFYSGLGWRLKGSNASEWKHPTVEFVWGD